jgi:hypothetical protein
MTTQTFNREAVFAGLTQYAAQERYRVSAVTLRRDIEVCIRCYLPRQGGRETDDSAEPLLADLGLLSEDPSDTFQFRRGPQHTLPTGVFAFALLEFWRLREKNTDGSQSTLAFETIAHDYGSPGRVFKLDEDSVADRLIHLESLTKGALRWSDSAGVRQVSRHETDLDDASLMKMLRYAYAH